MLCETCASFELAWLGVIWTLFWGHRRRLHGPEEERLIFDTRRVNQHFRRPWQCALPTPSSWAGLQLPANSACHMAQTDVNTAFYRMSAPDKMCEYFVLPGLSTQLLLQEGSMCWSICGTCLFFRHNCRCSRWDFLVLCTCVKKWWRAA